jgi:hypothetical protein
MASLLVLVGCAPSPSKEARHFDVVDRWEIINLLNNYSHTWDSARPDDWLKLFTKDGAIDVYLAGSPAIALAGYDQLRAYSERSTEHKKKRAQRRHLITNIVFKDQTSTTATVSMYLLLMSTAGGKELSAVGTGSYDGWLVKEEGAWKIRKWSVNLDAADNSAAKKTVAPPNSAERWGRA